MFKKDNSLKMSQSILDIQSTWIEMNHFMFLVGINTLNNIIKQYSEFVKRK